MVEYTKALGDLILLHTGFGVKGLRGLTDSATICVIL